jgi:hypothetical protein
MGVPRVQGALLVSRVFDLPAASRGGPMKLAISARGSLGGEYVRTEEFDLDAVDAVSAEPRSGTRLSARLEDSSHRAINEDHVQASRTLHKQLPSPPTTGRFLNERTQISFVPQIGRFVKTEDSMSRRVKTGKPVQQRSVYKTCTCCQRTFDLRTWHALPLLGRQYDGCGGYVFLKNCDCGTTLAAEAA